MNKIICGPKPSTEDQLQNAQRNQLAISLKFMSKRLYHERYGLLEPREEVLIDGQRFYCGESDHLCYKYKKFGRGHNFREWCVSRTRDIITKETNLMHRRRT